MDGLVRVFTDGSLLNPTITWAQRGGYGVFFGNCSYNISLPLYGFIQTSFRAELRAVLAALLACSLPLWITSDCLGVVNLLKAINEDQ